MPERNIYICLVFNSLAQARLNPPRKVQICVVQWSYVELEIIGSLYGVSAVTQNDPHTGESKRR